MGRGRRGDDEAVDRRQGGEIGRNAGGRGKGGIAGLPAAVHDVDIRAQRDQVAQDVAAPASASDQADVQDPPSSAGQHRDQLGQGASLAVTG